MPPKPKSVIFSILFLISISTTAIGQAPTSVDIMRDRISQAKAQLVVKNYRAAIYELENIRRETNDRTIHRVVNVLLMHAYLEQGDYERIQGFLTELFKSKEPTSQLDYLAVAGQVVSGAKTQFRRYQVLGLKVSDEKLPAFAVEDLDQMRKTLELIIDQSKSIGSNQKLSANSLALLEETSAARGSLARDDFDVKRWENEITYARQQIASSGSRVIDIVNDPPIIAPEPEIVAASLRKVEIPASANVDRADTSKTPAKPQAQKPAAKNDSSEQSVPADTVAQAQNSKPEVKADVPKPTAEPPVVEDDKAVAQKAATKPLPIKKTPLPTDRRVRVIGSAEKSPAKEDVADDKLNAESTDDEVEADDRSKNELAVIKNASLPVAVDSPISIGSLIGYATKRVNPVYPRQARTMRMTGVVKIELVIDEDGKVSSVENAEGPSLLQRAALDAVRKWQFRPFERDGQPVKATGFINFNFNL